MKGKIADSITVRYGHWTTTIPRKQYATSPQKVPDEVPQKNKADRPPKD